MMGHLELSQRFGLQYGGSGAHQHLPLPRSQCWPGAGYTGLTTAAELTLRGFRVRVVAAELGYRPPLTIVGTQVSIY